MENFLNTLKNLFGDALFNILNGIIALVLGFFVVKFLRFILRRLLNRLPINTTIATFLNSILSAILYLIYILIVLNAFNIATDGIVALVGSVGVAIGLALKDSLSNVANGIMLVTMKPFNVGDYVEVNGTSGTVVAIHMISTVLQTTDNKLITIPNNEVLSNNIINYNAMPTRRLDMTISVAYDSDIDLVRSTVLGLVAADERIFKDPAPVFKLDVMNSSSLDFTLRMWVQSGDYHNVKWQLNENIIKVFAEKNIEIPFQQVDIRMRKD